MVPNYFVNQYAPMNNIDPESDESIRSWLNNCITYYASEIGAHVGDLQGKSVLDLGCGIGGTLQYLLSRGAIKVTGVDKSADQLSICKKFVTENVVLADAIDYLRSAQQQYDCIVALDLIEHLPKEKISKFCHSLFQKLNTGGTVILRTPNMGSLAGLRSRYIDFTHEAGFTEESIRQVLHEAGFQHVEVHNSTAGVLRMIALKWYQRFIERLYNIPPAKVVTQNLITVAKKERE